MNNNKKIVIDDVAKAAGVSKSTISRYLNGKFEYMSEKTKKKIEDVIKKLDFRPNNIARSLKLKKSKLIGVIVADLINPFSSILIKGIGDACKSKGYNIIIVNSDRNPRIEEEYIESLLDQRVEGLIINSTGENVKKLISIKKMGIPIVMLDRTVCEEEFSTVTSNNYELTSQTINYLIDSGFTNLIFFTEDAKRITPRKEREKAFVDVCSKRLDTSNFYVCVIDHEEEGNIEINIRKFQNSHNGKKVIFAVNGVVLLNTLQAMKKLNIKIPDDIAICGYDNWGWAELINPGITTVSQPTCEMGFQAAKILIDKIENGSAHDIVHKQLKAKLEIRGSTVL
ncbi:LacI family DNA-binding transcriptional regulator [Clostridium sp. MT-14]|uniref:LacI family DNA-binding transcriptional regulator n=1 Tax=Clostridium sp. MT-14 TaxID=3348360 RepID=UPI0035F328F2